MMPRDLEKDLELCNEATKGPWYVGAKENGPNRLIANVSYFGFGKIYTRGQDANPGADIMFIAAAREGWPEAIERAMRAEKALELACEYIAEIATDCPFDLPYKCPDNKKCDKYPKQCNMEYYPELAREED